MTFALLEIDLTRGEGLQLVQAVSGTYPVLAAAPKLIEQAFLLRSEWAPGLCFVGAKARHRGFDFSVGGGGVSIQNAMASCLGEAAERASQVEREGDIVAEANLKEIAVLAGTRELIELIGRDASVETEWMLGRDLSGRQSLVPADWCLRRSPEGSLRVPGAALSTGCAAGPDADTASARGILELIERDAAALWWSGAREPHAMDYLPSARDLLSQLRGNAPERKTWLLDISSEIAVPVVAAVACDRDNRGLTIGLAARSTVEGAAAAAITETCQMELGLLLARAKADRRGVVTEDDERHLARATIDCTRDRRLSGNASFRSPPPLQSVSDLAQVTAALEQANVAAAIVDLTRSDIGVSAVKAIAPALQPMPCDLRTPRLAAAASAVAVWPPAIGLH